MRLFALFSLAAAGVLPCLAQSLILRHVTVIDMTGAAPRKDLSVSISGGRIDAVQKKIRSKRGDTVIDAKGKFLIPGLWDMHVHLGTPELDFPLLLANGVTGIREMYSGYLPAVLKQWQTRTGAPHILAPGFLDGPLILTSGPLHPGSMAVSTPEQARFAVDALARLGADFLKVYNSLPRPAYLAIADEAKRIGIPFVGHVPEEVSVAEAAEVGQLSEEHLNNILLACSTNEEQLRAERVKLLYDPTLSGEARLRLIAWPVTEGLFDTYSEEKAAALFQVFVRNGTWQTPTLALLEGFANPQARDPQALAWLPPAWLSNWDWRASSYLHDLTPTQYEVLNARMRALLDRYKKLVSSMHHAGVRFLAGTDVSPFNPVVPGFGLHDELHLLVESGFTPMEALECATRNPAQYLGQLDKMGTVEAGKAADLVLLDADPLEDIRNVNRIEAVVSRGRYYSRVELDEILENLKKSAKMIRR